MQVSLIDSMGTDLSVVNSARVSFSKESDWEKEYEERDSLFSKDMTGKPFKERVEKKNLSEADQKLIKYLAKNNHWTPFSHVMITMREKVPIFVARQRFKHMVGFTYNEVSRRYVDDSPDFFTPDVWRNRPTGSVKQGSGNDTVDFLYYDNASGVEFGEPPEIAISIKESYEYFIKDAEHLYNKMIEAGVAPEQARMVLPQSMYTEYYVTGSLAAWARAYKLRIDAHAQKEIRDLAKMWGTILEDMDQLKHSWEALTDGISE